MAKPKLALIPAAQGSKFYSVLPSSGVGDFTFTRSGSATRINSQGLIETVGNGVSRLNYPLIDGKVVGCPSHLLEPQRTNLITYSEDFSQFSNISDVSITTGFTAPDGTNTASKIVAAGGNAHIAGYYGINTGKRKSIYARTVSGTGKINLLNTSSLFDLTDQWQRFDITHSGADFFYAVDFRGANVTLSEVLIWGGQLEQGSFATSYIPTNGSTVTRSAETANGSGDASTFNDSEGVLMAEGSLLDVSQNFDKISISDGSSAENRIEFIYLNDNEIQIELGLTNGFNEILNVGSSKSFNKIAVVYNSTNASVFINGFNLVTNTMSSLNGLSQLQFNRFNSNIENFQGNVKQIQYYDSALTDSELEQLTSWVSFSDMANGQLYTIQ